jgi:phenylacetate-CoA ligase
MLHMAETALRLGRPLAESKVRSVTVGGEPGGSVPATRARIEELWGARCYDGYGSLEFQPIAWECAAQTGGHLPEDFLYAEVVDPDPMQVVSDGTQGVLVLTHLDKQAMPFVRWWTGDIVVRDPSPCACGRTLARLPGGVRGRADDMLVVKGVNLFPAAVEDVVRRMPQLTDEYLVVVDGDVRDADSGALSAIKLRVEAVGEITDGLADLVAGEIRAALTVRALVEVVPAGTLERSTHKSKRLLRDH